VAAVLAEVAAVRAAAQALGTTLLRSLLWVRPLAEEAAAGQ